MNRRVIYYVVGIGTVIILSNFLPKISIGKAYYYTTQHDEFTFSSVPTKGSGEEMMERVFLEFKNQNPQYKDLILYRTFPMEYWKFWKWREYLLSEKWKYPYLHVDN